MLTPSERAAAVNELQQIRRQVRQLVIDQPKLAEAIQAANAKDLQLALRFHAAIKSNVRRRCKLAIAVLKRGLLNDPLATGHGDALEYCWEGWCSTKLLEQIDASRQKGPLPRALERRAAKAALKSLVEDWAFQRSRPGSMRQERHFTQRDRYKKRRSLLFTPFRIKVLRPIDYAEPVDPQVPLDAATLRQLPEEMFLHVSLNVLGALADLGNPRPIIPEPGKLNDLLESSAASISWHARLWRVGTRVDGALTDEPDPDRLTPIVAKAMVEMVMKRFGPMGSMMQASTDAPPQLVVGDREVKSGPPEQPALRLQRQLGLVTLALSSEALIRTVEEARHDAQQRKSDGLSALSIGAMKRGNERLANGEGLEATFEEFRDLEHRADAPPATNLRPESLQQIEAAVSRGRDACTAAIAAIQEGGADALDRALSPGTSSQAVSLEVLLSEAESLLSRVSVAVLMPTASLDGFADLMAVLKGELSHKQRELKSASGLRSRYQPNPLLSATTVHPDLKPLFDALINVSIFSSSLNRCYPELVTLMESQGKPKPEDWPDTPAFERDRDRHSQYAEADRAEFAERGEDAFVVGFLESEWTEAIREWSDWYKKWCGAIVAAREEVNAPAVAAIMNEGEARPTHRWTTQTIMNLNNLAGTLHPICTGGNDGFGFIRFGLPPFPPSFHTFAKLVDQRVAELRAISPSVVVQGAGGLTAGGIDPALGDKRQASEGVDRNAMALVAEQAVAKALEAISGREKDEEQVPALPMPGPRDRDVYALMQIPGMTQTKAAERLNGLFPNEGWSQPRVSEAVARAKAHWAASGLADKVASVQSRAPARTLDPAVADIGQRTDGRSEHLREKMRQIAKEE